MNFSQDEIALGRLVRHIALHPKDRAALQKYNQAPAELRELLPLPRKAPSNLTGKFARQAQQTAKAMGWTQ